MVSGRRSYFSGYRLLGCAQTAYTQFAVEDLERLKAHDEKMFLHFRRELRRYLPVPNYFGIRQELRIASALLDKRVVFEKSETPDFILHTEPKIGIECTSVHLSENSPSKPDVAYKVNATIFKKSKNNYVTEQQILFIDTSNLLFHEGIHEAPVLARKEELSIAISAAVENSKFQSVLIFAYAWVPTGLGNGATLTNYYSRVDRSDISVPSKLLLDSHYPHGDIWVHGHLHRRV
jgi:hypothetical protein